MGKVSSAGESNSATLAEFFDGAELRRPAGVMAAETWADAHDAGAWALDLRAEAMTSGRWRSALAADVVRMTETAARVSLAMPPSPEGFGRLDAAEHALSGVPDDGRLIGDGDPPITAIVVRALGSRPVTARACARLASWLCRWASECVDVIVARGGPLVGAPASAPSLRDLANELRHAAAVRAGADEPGAAHVEAIAGFIVAQLSRADGAPFEGLSLPAWARAPLPFPSTGERARKGALSEAFEDLVRRVERLPADDIAGGAFLTVARRWGWGPRFSEDPQETPWKPWHQDALAECRGTVRKGADAVAAVRAALRGLGYDDKRFTHTRKRSNRNDHKKNSPGRARTKPLKSK